MVLSHHFILNFGIELIHLSFLRNESCQETVAYSRVRLVQPSLASGQTQKRDYQASQCHPS